MGTSQKIIFKDKIKLAAEAMEQGGLNWNVYEDDLITMGGVNCPFKKAIVREDTRTIIGVTGRDYTPAQNSDTFAFFDLICKNKNAHYESATIIDGGRLVKLRIKINGVKTIREHDGLVQYIDGINSFDGSTKFRSQFSVVRLVCQNGLVALRGENAVNIKHCKYIVERMQKALLIYKRATTYFDKFIELSRSLANKAANKAMVKRFIDKLEGGAKTSHQEEVHETIYGLYEAGMGNGMGTRWDMYNAYTEWLDHHKTSEENREYYNDLNYNKSIKERAFDLALVIK